MIAGRSAFAAAAIVLIGVAGLSAVCRVVVGRDARSTPMRQLFRTNPVAAGLMFYGRGLPVVARLAAVATLCWVVFVVACWIAA